MAIEINFKPSQKQEQVLLAFSDGVTTEAVYGGGLGGGKSFSLCALVIMKCIQFAGIRVGIARNTLTNLKRTTVVSMLEVLHNWKLQPDTHYNYNSQAGIIKFSNGSEIILIDLTYMPSDPQYTRLGGLLLTFGCIDECTEVDEKAKNIFQTRLGRWMNEKYSLKPFLLMTCNPSKSSFIYREFYKPFKEGKLKHYQKFIQALPKDNPFLPKQYIENLNRTLSLVDRKRLLLGHWELEDDTSSLFRSADIQLMYDSSIVLDQDITPRMSCDIAFTSDNCVIIVWAGLTVKHIIKVEKKSDQPLIDLIKSIAQDNGVKTSNICWDADGVGKYIKGHFSSGYEIHNNAKTVQNHGYANLKTELYFKLSEMVAQGKIKIEDHDYSKEVDEELSVIKHKPKENSTSKIELVSKGEQKRILGRSPDIADALAYGMIFHLKNQTMTASDFSFVSF